METASVESETEGLTRKEQDGGDQEDYQEDSEGAR